MNKIAFAALLIIMTTSSTIFAAESKSDLSGISTVAVEVRQNNIFKDMIGSLQFHYDGSMIVLVAFSRFSLKPEQALVAPTVYRITKTERTGNSTYYLEGANQYGFRISGTVDTTTSLKPVVDFALEDGLRVVNISGDGRKFKEELVPRLRLGGQD